MGELRSPDRHYSSWLWTNYKTYTAVRIVAWKGSQDPSTGKFFLSGDPSTGLQILIWRGTIPYWRSGMWNGATASGLTGYRWSQIIDNGEEIYSTYNMANGSQITNWKLDYTGDVNLRIWNNQSLSWVGLYRPPGNGCRHYGSCGPLGYCDITVAILGGCRCLDGFEPADGFSLNFSRGCVRKEASKCGNDYFLNLAGMKVPDKFVYTRSRSFEECAAECNHNCSCTAYAYANLSTILTTGDLLRCLVWIGELVDSVKAGDIGDNLYLRLAGSPANNKNSGVVLVLKIVFRPVILCLLILTCIYLVRICKPRGIQRNKENLKRPVLGHLSTLQEVWDQNLEFPCIRFEDIAAATNSFHDTNILGKGGFGKVYKVV